MERKFDVSEAGFTATTLFDKPILAEPQCTDNMSKEDFAAANAVCKQRFKGIENFLKRVAFNLGNTPSQTEVKIISCIPIDVTDLQQKILHLEKQLGEVNAARASPSETSKLTSKTSKTNKLPKTSKTSKQSSHQKRTAVNTAIIESSFPNVSAAAISCKSLDCDRSTSPICCQNKRKSNVSFIFPAINTNDTPLTNSNDNSDTSQGAIVAVRDINMDPYYTALQMAEPKPNNQRRTFFKKKKKILKNKKANSPYVYYAQTNNSSPFNKSDVIEEVPKYESGDVMTRSYLAQMINKQYKPKMLGDDISLISQFSSPVCRDVQPRCEGTCRYESDICSCCHGPFHNIDDHINKLNNPQTYMLNEINTGNAYYDTNQYDLVPVKEKPTKIKKDLEMPRKKEPRTNVDMKCWPENVRTRYRYQTLYPLLTNNHYTARPRADYIKDIYGKKKPVKFNRIEPIARKVAKRRKEMYRREQLINIETSKSCSIDFGNVYRKKTCRKPKKQESLQPIPVPKKNAECLTTIINNSECQTTMSTFEANSADAKTEATLNQIKNILQSVLAEVKVSSQTKTQVIQDKPKKDAVVQKGPSHNNMQTSSLMNSFTYSPYTMNPTPYMASCSRQSNPSQFCYPYGGMKCFHNFPLFIQAPGGRHMCASCYRNSSHIKSGYMKQAATIATNTEDAKEDRSKETEKLIKEIYKSMALTMDLPNKDTSLSEYDEMMKSLQGFTTPIILKTEPKKQPKKIRNVVQAVSELFMKKDMIDTSDTLNTTVESKLPSNETSTRSQLVTTTDSELRMGKEKFEKYLRPKNMQPAVPEVEKKTFHEAMVQNANTVTESETSSSEAESDTTIVVTKNAMEPKHKKEKPGLFSKMFKSVKLFKPREKSKKREEKTESDEETTSDSDDYQTVYSQKIDKIQKYKNRPHNLPKRKTHSKISYKQPYQRDRSPEKRRSPYMEQEYRRYWDERLMFHDNRPRHSSERLYSEQTTPQKSAYYQTYETRNALVEPKTHVPKTEQRLSREYDNKLELKSKGIAWLKKHKVGIHCGEQWKKFILES